jgi:hypothetical protein
VLVFIGRISGKTLPQEYRIAKDLQDSGQLDRANNKHNLTLYQQPTTSNQKRNSLSKNNANWKR